MNILEEAMKSAGIPVTRYNYLTLNAMGGPIPKPTAEDEREMPESIRSLEMTQAHPPLTPEEKKPQTIKSGEGSKKKKPLTVAPKPPAIPHPGADIVIGGGARGTEQMSDELRQKQQQFEQKNLKQQNDVPSGYIAGPNEQNVI